MIYDKDENPAPHRARMKFTEGTVEDDGVHTIYAAWQAGGAAGRCGASGAAGYTWRAGAQRR